jgi:hypothetical protein
MRLAWTGDGESPKLPVVGIGLLSQATTTAVSVVTVHALSFHNWRVLL